MTAVQYSVFKGGEMTLAQWQAVSRLFSTEYGFYSPSSPVRAGLRVRLGVGYYRRNYANDDCRVALCFAGEDLIGHAIYREFVTSRGKVALVVQLVVAEAHRRHGIASTLLHAIWGFSDYYAWGIVSSNPFTIEALEAATFRKADAAIIAAHENWLVEEVVAPVYFLKYARLTLDGKNSRAYTGFHVDHGGMKGSSVSGRLGRIGEGEEWLAVVFREQPLDDFAAYRNMVEASSEFVFNAYARMPQVSEPWAKEADSEIEAILEIVPDIPPESRIVDFGAGCGRHLAALRKRGFTNVTGVEMALQPDSDLAVVHGDCRNWSDGRPVDLLLCLYDVIGSFPNDEDNAMIVKNIAGNLREGGMAVVSVSNYAYLDCTKIAKIDFDNPAASMSAVFNLLPSRTMGTSGEFFDPNYLLVDEKRHLVCHKEQFTAGRGTLPGEYLIRDRRYLKEEIENLMEENGLEIVRSAFVRAGFKEELSEKVGKEILVVSRRILKGGGK